MQTHWIRALALTGAALCSSAANAGLVTFNFAPVGKSLSYFLAGDNPIVGQRIISTHIVLRVESFAGSDAANFFTDHSFPILPDEGNTSALAWTGSELGWSGSGIFEYTLDTDMFNGVFTPARYGSETPGFDFDGVILEGSVIEMTTVPAPGAFAGAGLLGLTALARRRRR